jgi:hypothetical protein
MSFSIDHNAGVPDNGNDCEIIRHVHKIDVLLESAPQFAIKPIKILRLDTINRYVDIIGVGLLIEHRSKNPNGFDAELLSYADNLFFVRFF